MHDEKILEFLPYQLVKYIYGILFPYYFVVYYVFDFKSFPFTSVPSNVHESDEYFDQLGIKNTISNQKYPTLSGCKQLQLIKFKTIVGNTYGEKTNL
jgi:hypothetical protein